MIAPSPETTIDKVLTVAVLLGHLPEALSINKSGVDIRTLLNCSSRAVDNDSHALDAKVARKVEHAVVTNGRRSVGVGVVQFGHRDQEVARYLRQVDAMSNSPFAGARVNVLREVVAASAVEPSFPVIWRPITPSPRSIQPS